MISSGLPDRLKNSREYRRVYEQGRRYSTPFFNAFLLVTEPWPTKSDQFRLPARFGITVTRKIGNAVIRNRCKRRFREIVRHYFTRALENGRVPGGFDIVLNARSAMPGAEFRDIEASFEKMIETFLRNNSK
ncbi:MAG: ribonuclease P protein component [Blastocatellia bacterium]|jgi:ribonuclease P protein component